MKKSFRFKRVPFYFSWLCLLTLGAGARKVSGQIKTEANRYGDTRQFIPASPVASMFTIFGHTPVSYYTGLPEINVPLHQVGFKDLAIDLNLMYHAAIGNRPDAMPGSVGNGWLLTFGGTITRISKAVRPSDFPNPESVPNNFNPTASPTWSSNASMQSYIDNATVFQDPDCRYDEYAYNFLGMSGKFFKDHNGVQHFKTDQGESLTLQTVTETSRTINWFSEPQGEPYEGYSTPGDYRPSMDQKNYISTFTITDSRGIKYIFGQSNEAIEFSKPGLATGDFDEVLDDFDELEKNTVPTTWYLTSIVSPNGYAISLNYRRGRFYVTSESYSEGLVMTHSKMSGLTQAPFAKAIKSTIIHPSYLESITTPNSTINFYWSLADQQLQYDYNPSPNVSDPNFPMYFMHYVDVKDAIMEDRVPDKLDSFKVFSNNQLKKLVQFNYTDDSETRLKLLSVAIKGNSTANKGYDLWQFEYDSTPLPDYLSFETDKYGFYNGHNEYDTSSDPGYYKSLLENPTTRADYLASKEPDTNYSRAEILNKLIYPTGGYTTFEYENNDYGRQASFWPIAITENAGGQAKITGGLRIRATRTFDAANHQAGQKRYVYKKDYSAGGQTSSGVLNYEPIFYESFSGDVSAPANKAGNSSFDGSLTYSRWSTNPLYPASYYKGTHVTYSEVTEINLDGSYSVYKFNNYDNGFHDKPAENMVCDNSNVGEFYKEDDVNSMELERGKLQSEQLYTNNNQLVRKIEYLYDTMSARFNDNVRILKAIPNPIFSANFPSLRYVATLQYTYFPYLMQKRQVDYTSSNDSLVNIEKYSFDNNRLLKEKNIVLSNGRTKRIINRYTEDMIAAGQSAPYTAMENKHIVGALVETEERLDTSLLMINSTPYASGLSPNSGIYRPAFSKTKYKYGAAETRMTYHKYDAVGNPVFQSKDNVSRVCYLWSYDRLYPIAQIINASYDTVEAILTGPAIDNFATLAAPSYAQINTFVNQLRNDPRMSKAMITSYSYDPLFGMTSETDVNGKTTYYEYDYLGRLHVVKDKDLNVVKVICYNYAGQATDCSIQRLTGSRLFYYGSTKTTACSAPGAPPQTVQIKAAYYRSQIAGIDSGTIKYYRDAAMTQLLETGYYVDSPATVSGSTLYYYIVNGEVIYTATCGSADPFLLGYRTTWQSSNMCDGTFPIEAIFTLGQAPLVLNAYCFSDPQLTTHVADGYYILEDKYYHIVSGQVVSVDYCQPPSTKVLVRDPNFQDVCDAQTFGTYTVYYRGAFDEGTVLYANSAMTTTLGRGHYSDRSSVITVNSNGSISIKMTCTEAANLPPSQVPAPIP